MRILYVRVSTSEQNTDRQKVNESDFDLVIEDKCSGAIPFFERPGGQEIKMMMDNSILKSVAVYSCDRLGRDLRDLLNTIHVMTQEGINIEFVAQGLRTLDAEGKENPISRLMISILGTVGEMERKQIRERQLEGIRIAKLKNRYTGRLKGSTEDTLSFLGKEKNKKALEYLKKGFKNVDVAKLTGLNVNTITKVKKLGLINAV